MEPDEIRERVLDLLAEVTGSAAVRSDPDLALYDSGLLDSLGTVTLMAAFGDELGVEVSPAAWDRAAWATPARLVGDLAARVAAVHGAAPRAGAGGRRAAP